MLFAGALAGSNYLNYESAEKQFSCSSLTASDFTDCVTLCIPSFPLKRLITESEDS